MSTEISTRKILAFTGIRSDYDLLSSLYLNLNQISKVDLRLIISGAHLSPTFGRSVDAVRKDGVKILAEIESLIDANTRSSRIKSAAGMLFSCIHNVAAFAPDLILYAGDREDALMAAMMSTYLGIPGAHFFGGDHAVDGNVDNPIRHAITKLSSIHFVTLPQHRDRIIAMGESPRRIFITGNPALDSIKKLPNIDQAALNELIGGFRQKRFAVVIYHPTHGHEDSCSWEFKNILDSLILQKIPAIVAMPNIDAGSNKIISVASTYKNDATFKFIDHLDRLNFVNILRHAALLIGNSSAGILEAPLLELPVVNVGIRQRGRLSANNVIFCDGDANSIGESIAKATSQEFKSSLKGMLSPYGNGDSVVHICKLLTEINYKDFLLKTEDPLFNLTRGIECPEF